MPPPPIPQCRTTGPDMSRSVSALVSCKNPKAMSKSVLSQKLEASPETKHNGRVSFNRSHGKHITRGCQLCSAHITESLQCETPNNSSALACHLLARKTVFVLQALNVSSSYMMGRACITIRAVKNSSLPCDVQRKEVRKLLV